MVVKGAGDNGHIHADGRLLGRYEQERVLVVVRGDSSNIGDGVVRSDNAESGSDKLDPWMAS
jgi:hypothetical protein